MDAFLKKVPLFADLPDADLRRLGEMMEEVRLPAHAVLFTEGSPGDRAYIIREGQLEVVKVSGGRQVLLSVANPGDVIGEMALLENTPRMATVRARTDCVLAAVSKEQLDHLLSTSHSAVWAMFRTVLARWRSTEAVLRHSEKMAQLGTLTAGVAHELKNPAAAVHRGAEQLRDALERLSRAESDLARLALTPVQREALEEMARRPGEHLGVLSGLDAVARSDREQSLQVWLDERGVQDSWDLAPTLVDLGFDAARLAEMSRHFPPHYLAAALNKVTAAHTVSSLVREIQQGSERISDIVRALKSYSYLDQAPVQAVSVHEGLDNTLLILRHKLKSGITVQRDYAPDLPRIEAYGSEINQVWTNILDNAADALEGRGGKITIRTRREREGVVVEIEDNGPGIPQEIQPRIFDSFFTTKPPGRGTGLGLSISYNVVVHKHRGEIKVSSQPGRTCFQVWLPINFEAM